MSVKFVAITGFHPEFDRLFVEQLAAAGYSVRCWKSVAPPQPSHLVTSIDGVLDNVMDLSLLIQDADVVVHTAECSPFSKGGNSYGKNTLYIQLVIDACLAQQHLPCLYYVGSAYHAPAEDDLTWSAELHPYLQSKRQCELEVCRAREEGLPVCILSLPHLMLPLHSGGGHLLRAIRLGSVSCFDKSISISYIDARYVAKAVVQSFEKELMSHLPIGIRTVKLNEVVRHVAPKNFARRLLYFFSRFFARQRLMEYLRATNLYQAADSSDKSALIPPPYSLQETLDWCSISS